MSATTYLNKDGTLFATPTASASADAWSTKDDSDRLHPYHAAGGANASASIGSYTGVDAGLTAYKYGHDNAELKLGLGIDTGIGFRENSVQVKVLGCGVQFGDTIGFSFFGSEIKGKNMLSGLKFW